MKGIRWITSFLVFNLLFILASLLTEKYLGWFLNIGGWKWIAIVFFIPIYFTLAASTVTITALVSPNRFRTPILIRWFCGVCLILGFIYFAIVGFKFGLLEINNLIFLLFIVKVSSPERVMSFLEGSGV
jgi:hypothetical protein